MAQGTFDDPMTLTEALSSDRILPGHTVWLRGGVYNGDFSCTLEGTAEAPITIRNYPGEQAIIDGSMTIGGAYTHWIGSHKTGQGIVFRYTGWTQRTTEYPDYIPPDIPQVKLKIDNEGCSVINCVMHNLSGGEQWRNAGIASFYGNVTFNYGWLGPDRGHGPGLYTQNNTPRRTVKHNVFINHFGSGLQAYGSDAAYVNYFDVIGNTLHGSYRQINCLVGGGGGAIAPTISGNNLYLRGGIGIGYTTDAPATDVTYTNNYSPEGESVDAVANFLEQADNWAGPAPHPARVTLYPNEYEDEIALLTVYNWDSLETMTVDVSSWAAAGNTLRLRSTQDYFNDTADVTVAGDGTIAVDMRAVSHTLAVPLAWTGEDWPVNAFPIFGCFIVEKL